jgi:hypothetical protein
MTLRALFLLVAIPFLAVDAPGQGVPPNIARTPGDSSALIPRAPRTTGLEMHVRLSGAYADNFLQAPDAAATAELVSSTVESRLVLRTRRPTINAYVQASRTISWLFMTDSQCPTSGSDLVCVFDGFEPDQAINWGVEMSAGRVHLESRGGKQNRSPRLFGGDEADFATISWWEGGYGLTFPGRIQLNMVGHNNDVFLQTRRTENHYYGAGSSLRFRGFGYRFSPEIGAMRSFWKTPAAADNYEERTRWMSLRMIPFSALYLHVRYRLGQRLYSIDDPLAGNYGREDDRRNLTVSADLKLSRRVTWSIYHTHEGVSSTREERSFSTNYLTSGLSFRLW